MGEGEAEEEVEGGEEKRGIKMRDLLNGQVINAENRGP